MIKSNKSPYFWKFLWIIGLIILSVISENIKNQMQQTAFETYDFVQILWFNLLISILFGLYISLIIVKKWSFHLNQPLLWCITIPSILLSLFYPILVTLASFESLQEKIANLPLAPWFVTAFSSEVWGIILGLSIILSLFNAHPNNKSKEQAN